MSKSIEKPIHYYNAPRKEMLRFIPQDARKILEVGCGEGRFGAELKRVRLESNVVVEITGIEIDREQAERAKDRLDHVIACDVERENSGLGQQTFDCILCNDVLEHLVSPARVLEELRSLLRPGGYLVASIPNVRYWGVIKDLLFNAEWRYVQEGVLDATHLRFFTFKSIRRLFQDAGYEVLAQTGINSHVHGWKFSLLNTLTRGHFDDIQFLQFAVVARRPCLES